MAISLPSERPATAAWHFNPVSALLRAFTVVKRARRQRRALIQLLDHDDALLEDMGLCRQDIFEALANSRRPAGQALNAARATRARLWFRLT